MFGESTGDWEKSPRNYSWGWMGCGTMPLRFRAIPNPDDVNSWAGFSSKHSGVAQFTMGDGSVRSIRKYIPTSDANFVPFLSVTGWRDGQVSNTSSFMP